MLVVRNLLLRPPDLLAKRCRVRDGVLEIVLGVGIGVDTDGQNVSGTGPFEATRANETQRSILALDVITIEGVSRQPVLSGDDCYVGLQGGRSLPFQHIAAPNLYERTIAKQPHIAAPAPRLVIFIGWHFSYFNLHYEIALGRGAVTDLSVLSYQIQLGLAAVELRYVFGSARLFPGHQLSEQPGIVELVEEGFRRHDIKCVASKPPKDLLPCSW